MIIIGDYTIHRSWDTNGWRMASTRNLSLQFVNSTICTLSFGLGVKCALFVGGALKMHNILGLSRVMHLHLGT
jgi:hypothetical protein